jgi:Ca2+-transporting ATPase
VLIRRLAAVEALGSVTVLAADKTGTLTTGRLRLARVWTPADSADARLALLAAAVLCSDAEPVSAGRQQRADPIEVALVDGAAERGVDVDAVRASQPRIAEEPFDAMTARMTTTHRGRDGSLTSYCKGSPEVVCVELTAEPAMLAEAERLAAEGYRVLAVACRTAAGWQPLGVLAFADPPREDARGVIAAFRRAGVRTIMITGDHASTAGQIARELGIDATEDVFPRVRPDGKTAIVAGLQSAGEVVAMTGDGVNDAPALRAADIGVAMGRRGTEVAKQAAAIVLTNDDLAPMVTAIGEGRRAYDNVRRFLRYALSGGVAEVLIMLGGPLAGFPLPLGAGQILWVNLLTHGLPGVAMGNEPADPDVLARAPRRPDAQLLDRRTLAVVAGLAAVIAACSLAAGAVARHGDRPWQSTIFVTLTFAQLAVALSLHGRWNRSHRNPALLASVALNVVLVLLAVWWRPLRELLGTQPLRPLDLLPCLAGAAVAAVAAVAGRR